MPLPYDPGEGNAVHDALAELLHAFTTQVAALEQALAENEYGVAEGDIVPTGTASLMTDAIADLCLARDRFERTASALLERDFSNIY